MNNDHNADECKRFAGEREGIARAIWNIRREDEDRCDMELEDMPRNHSVWREADAVMQARAAQPAPVVPEGLNKTRDQWQKVDAKYCAENNSPAANYYLIRDAQRDIERLHRALAAAPAQPAPVVPEGYVQVRRQWLCCLAWDAELAPRYGGASKGELMDALDKIRADIDALLAAAPAQGQQVDVTRVKCAACQGNGYIGEEPVECGVCEGRGSTALKAQQVGQKPGADSVQIVTEAIDGPCRDAGTMEEMALIICDALVNAGYLRLSKAVAADFKAPVASTLARFGLGQDDAESLGAESHCAHPSPRAMGRRPSPALHRTPARASSGRGGVGGGAERCA
jgi:hypothetical protein